MNANKVRWNRLARVAVLGGGMALLSACATPYGGYPGSGYPGAGYPDAGYPGSGHPGSPYPGSPPRGGYGAEAVIGTVREVDPGYGRIVIDADGGAYGGSRPLELFFDRGTRLVYQGREYPVEGLERGDRIRVETVRAGDRLQARFIEVVHNVRDAPGGGVYGGGLEGAVRFVDPRARLIEVTRGGYSGRPERVFYDERTQVTHRGRYLRPEQLQPGDVIRVQARPFGQDWMAERIDVQVDARSRYP